MIKFSAGGFRDFTRIAASDPIMWRDVFLNNKEAVLEMLGRFSEDLTALQRAIRFGDGDTLYKLFVEARATRRGIIEAGQDTAAPDFGRHGGQEILSAIGRVRIMMAHTGVTGSATPLPLAGRGWGWGYRLGGRVQCCAPPRPAVSVLDLTQFPPRLHPTPNPSPSRGGGPVGGCSHCAMTDAPHDLWVFGYGSLMWRPGFAYEEARHARLTGYRRCFCIYSVYHRGTAGGRAWCWASTAAGRARASPIASPARTLRKPSAICAPASRSTASIARRMCRSS